MARRILLILASASPRRRQLLKQLKIPFHVMPSHVSERSSEKNPIRLVRELALRKANQIAKGWPLTPVAAATALSRAERDWHAVPSPMGRGRGRGGHGVRGSQSVFILGADTVVVLRGKILGKPRDARHAHRMLSQLSGSRHHVYTGVALVKAGTQKSAVAHAKSEVRMKKISEDQLVRLSKKHLDKAGSYAIQEKRDPIARLVKGSYDNVVGLPLATVRMLLKKLSRGV